MTRHVSFASKTRTGSMGEGGSMVVEVRSGLSHRLFRSAWGSLLITLWTAGILWAGGGPRNVAVVINVNSPESREI
ncbi:MAG: hypothetical protein ACPL7K_07790, partial [Armatimonadota bacterium]